MHFLQMKYIKHGLETIKEYKEFKGLRKESLRDNIDNIELILIDLSEEAIKRLVNKQKPIGLKENLRLAKIGGNALKVAKETLEENLKENVVTKNNKLNYKYNCDATMIDNK